MSTWDRFVAVSLLVVGSIGVGVDCHDWKLGCSIFTLAVGIILCQVASAR